MIKIVGIPSDSDAMLRKLTPPFEVDSPSTVYIFGITSINPTRII
jgi:hypothetical protein